MWYEQHISLQDYPVLCSIKIAPATFDFLDFGPTRITDFCLHISAELDLAKPERDKLDKYKKHQIEIRLVRTAIKQRFGMDTLGPFYKLPKQQSPHFILHHHHRL